MEEVKDLPERKEDVSMTEHGKNTVTRDTNEKITIHITTEKPDKKRR